MTIRTKLYDLLTNCIPSDVIFQKLVDALLNQLDNEIKLDVINLAAFYEHRCRVGSKEIFHLEAFVAKFMAM